MFIHNDGGHDKMFMHFTSLYLVLFIQNNFYKLIHKDKRKINSNMLLEIIQISIF